MFDTAFARGPYISSQFRCASRSGRPPAGLVLACGASLAWLRALSSATSFEVLDRCLVVVLPAALLGEGLRSAGRVTFSSLHSAISPA
jgi:hypothetical protein